MGTDPAHPAATADAARVLPAALLAFDDLAAPDALELLGRAPDPVSAALLSTAQITAQVAILTTLNTEIKTMEEQGERIWAAPGR